VTEKADSPWPITWSAVSDAQREIYLQATPAQRLAWAEELLDLARMAGVLPENPTFSESHAIQGNCKIR